MNKKKILIITHGFFPEQSPRSFRATELAKEFFRQGHEVSVMAPQRDNLKSFLDIFPIEFISLGSLSWYIPNIKGMGNFGALINKVLNRFIPLFSAFPSIEIFFKIKKKLREESRTYDIVISIAVPYTVHWGVAAVWQTNKKKNLAPIWIADCGDPFMGQQNDTFKPPFYFGWIEKWFCRKADFLAVPTEGAKDGYYTEFQSKIKVIPQGFRFEDIKTKSSPSDGVIRFGYGGAFILKKRDPREFLDFLTTIDQSIDFEFHIFTTQLNLVEPYTIKDSRIKLHPIIPRLELLELLSSFQFVVNFTNKGNAQTPSKLIDYAIIKKPILQIETGNLDITVVCEFLQGSYEKQFQVLNTNQYRIENVATQFLIIN